MWEIEEYSKAEWGEAFVLVWLDGRCGISFPNKTAALDFIDRAKKGAIRILPARRAKSDADFDLPGAK